jgi:hypothetical protein
MASRRGAVAPLLALPAASHASAFESRFENDAVDALPYADVLPEGWRDAAEALVREEARRAREGGTRGRGWRAERGGGGSRRGKSCGRESARVRCRCRCAARAAGALPAAQTRLVAACAPGGGAASVLSLRTRADATANTHHTRVRANADAAQRRHCGRLCGTAAALPHADVQGACNPQRRSGVHACAHTRAPCRMFRVALAPAVLPPCCADASPPRTRTFRARRAAR